MATYPGAVPSFPTHTDGATQSDTTPSAVLTAAEVNAIQAETVAIATELGTDPSGASATVAARLAALDSTVAGKADGSATTAALAAKAALAGATYTGAHDFTGATVTGIAGGGGALAPETYLDAQIPILEITTAAKAPIVSKVTYLDAVMTIKGGRPDQDPFVSTVQIRGRGNSTWALPKKPYRLKLPSGAAAPLLGMPSDRDWVLLANAADDSGIRTAVALWIGQSRSGLAWTPRFRWVELHLNGTYLGLYQLGQNVKIASTRVNITKMAAGDTAGLAVTGGYSLEIDERLELDPTLFGFRTTLQSIPVTFDEPDGAVAAQFDYLRDHVNLFEQTLYGSNWLDSSLGYARFIDMPSFIDWYLVEELVSNRDSGFFSSCKLYKQRDTVDTLGRLFMGPLWDFDLSLGNAIYSHSPTAWYTRNGAKWIARMFSDPAFYALLVSRWQSLRDFLTTSSAVDGKINLSTATVHGALLRDQAAWGYTADWSATSTAMKTWLSTRIAWLDTQLTLANAPTGAILTTPTSPSALAGVAGSSQVALSWTAPTNNGGAAITDYRVEYKLASSEVWLVFADGTSTATTATVTGLTNGQTYDFRVSAINSVGFGSTTGVRVVIEPSPTGLTPTPGDAQVALSWAAPVGGATVTDYLVQYKASASGTWLTFADGVSTATTATVTGLTNGTAYDFRVSAVTASGTSPASATATATPSATVTAPGAPTSLAATPGSTQVALAWVAPASNGGAAITDYVVQYKLTSSGTWSTFTDGVSTAVSATVTGLASGGAYDFRVSAVNSLGTGSASSVVSATTTSYAAAVAALPNLVAYYPLDESTGTTMTDTSGNSHAGTYSGGVTLGQAGLVEGGACVAFDGTSGKGVVAAASWLAQAPLTITAVVTTPTTMSGNRTIVSRPTGTGPRMLLRTEGSALKLYFNGGTWGTVNGPTLSPSTRYRISAVIDGTLQSIYVNGVLAGSFNAVASTATNDGALAIGVGDVLTSEYWSGQIDNVSFHQAALSGVQIAALHTAAGA